MLPTVGHAAPARREHDAGLQATSPDGALTQADILPSDHWGHFASIRAPNSRGTHVREAFTDLAQLPLYFQVTLQSR
jgi:hypothetical protein